jgi:hypothetical protein
VLNLSYKSSGSSATYAFLSVASPCVHSQCKVLCLISVRILVISLVISQGTLPSQMALPGNGPARGWMSCPVGLTRGWVSCPGGVLTRGGSYPVMGELPRGVLTRGWISYPVTDLRMGELPGEVPTRGVLTR